jgi:hypothetical protein
MTRIIRRSTGRKHDQTAGERDQVTTVYTVRLNVKRLDSDWSSTAHIAFAVQYR